MYSLRSIVFGATAVAILSAAGSGVADGHEVIE
jgi:hypothetical protein